MHLSGLGGISNDIGLAIAASSYVRLRTLAINSLAEISGSRFGRGLFAYGGVRFDINEPVMRRMREKLDVVRSDVSSINDFLFSATGALSSALIQTGLVTKKQAHRIGLLGVAARASGMELDARTNFPYGAYRYLPVSLISLPSGDVYARARLRALEIDESFRFIYEQLENLPSGDICAPSGTMMPEKGYHFHC